MTPLAAAPLLVLAACSTEPRPPAAAGERFTLVEHVRVAGSCFEDHVGESAKYAGFVDRWHDGKKNRELLHGSVTNFDRANAAAAKKYLPPATIQFGEVGADQLSGTRVVLKGLAGGSPPSAATCTLDVKNRERPAARGSVPPWPIRMTTRNALTATALVIGLVAGVRMARQQVRRTAAPVLLILAFLLQLASLLLP